MLLKSYSFINTMLNEEYRLFVLENFKIEMIFKNFNGWSSEEMGSWVNYYNDKSTIAFFGDKIPYSIKNPKLVGDKTFMFPFPRNLDDFINDCLRCSITLQWNETVMLHFDKKHLMKQSELKEYFDNLLIKLKKK